MGETPRTPSMKALMILGSHAGDPGWLAFLREMQAAGFGISQPGDDDLSDDDWDRISTNRVLALSMAFQRSAEVSSS